MHSGNNTFNSVIKYLNKLGYKTEMIDYKGLGYPDNGIDLVININKNQRIAVEIKTNSDLYNTDTSDISYHNVARKLQRTATDIGAEYYLVTDGFHALWLKTADNGRPKVISTVYASDLEESILSYSEQVDMIIKNASNYLKQFPITRNAGYDMSLAIYGKLKKDLYNDNSLLLSNSELNISNDSCFEKENLLKQLINSWNNINFIDNKLKVIQTIDNYLENSIYDFEVPRWLADFMVSLYPENKKKNNALDMFSRYGSLISSALKGGWKNVEGYYSNKENEYWIRSQILLSNGKVNIRTLESALSDKINENIHKQFDCVFMIPPFTSKLASEKEYFEILLNQALKRTKKNGYMIILIPNKMLSSMHFEKFRKSLMQETNIKGIFNLNQHALGPHSSILTSILVVEKNSTQSLGTFICSIEKDPSINSGNNSLSAIQKNWKAYNQEITISQGVTGFITNQLNSENFHYSNYFNNTNELEMDEFSSNIRVIPLIQIAKIIKRGRPYKKYKSTEIPYLSPSAVREMKLQESELSFTGSELEPKNPVFVEDEDIIINIIGSQSGSTAIVEKEFIGLGINQNLILIRPDMDLIDPYYLALAINSEYVQSQLQNISKGTVIPSLNLRSIESLYIPIYSLEMQKNISTRYKNMLHEIEKKEHELNIAKQKLKVILHEIGEEGKNEILS